MTTRVTTVMGRINAATTAGDYSNLVKDEWVPLLFEIHSLFFLNSISCSLLLYFTYYCIKGLNVFNCGKLRAQTLPPSGIKVYINEVRPPFLLFLPIPPSSSSLNFSSHISYVPIFSYTFEFFYV